MVIKTRTKTATKMDLVAECRIDLFYVKCFVQQLATAVIKRAFTGTFYHTSTKTSIMVTSSHCEKWLC